MRRSRLITGLFFLLGIVVFTRAWVQFGRPLFSNAQVTEAPTNTPTSGPDNVGPHAAFFDVGNNVGIAQMVKGKTSKNLPITVQIDINASVEEVRTVLSATQGLQPIIRIVGITYNTDPFEGFELANVISNEAVRSLIPNNTLIVFGNELNNLDREYDVCPQDNADASKIIPCPERLIDAGQKYGSQFAEFVGALPSGVIGVPAPPDMYNANYEWKVFTDNAGVYGGELVANVYDTLVPDRPENAGSPPLELYKKLGNVVAFTEYGPTPTSSLPEHIAFYQQHPVPGGIRYATTLIPDRCSSTDFRSDQWLFYVDGAIYTQTGVQVDPASCDTTGGAEPPEGDYYHRFIYPFYYQDPNDTDELKVQLEKRLAADYQLSCVQPAQYETFLGGTGSIQELFTKSGFCRGKTDDACLFEPEASLALTTKGLQQMFGVLRDEKAARWRAYDQSQTENVGKRSFTSRFESVEQWFGANNPETQNYSNSTPVEIKETHQGPFYKLARPEMQCQAAASIMKATSALCDQWYIAHPDAKANGEFCPLDKPIQGTGYSMGKLNEELVAIVGNTDVTRSPGQIACDIFYAEEENPDKSKLEPLINVMNKVDLYMETAYRPAFLVMVTEVDLPGDTPNAGNKTGTIRPTEQANPSKHIVDYLVYHIPATLTDINLNSSYAHEDVVSQTVNAFTDRQTIDQNKIEAQSFHDRVASELEAVRNLPTDNLPVSCATPDCQEVLRSALIDFINVVAPIRQLSCDGTEIKAEDKVEFGKIIGSRLEAIDQPEIEGAKNGEDVDTAEVDVRISQYYDRNGTAPAPKTIGFMTKIYNIAPVGFQSGFVATQIDSLFTSAQQKEFNAQGYLEHFGAVLGKDFQTIEDRSGGYFEVDPETAIPYIKEVTGGVKLANEEIPFTTQFLKLGKVFNRSTRAITQVVTGWGTNAWNCAVGMTNPNTNTEDFLTKCRNGGTASVPPGTIPPALCEINGGFPIASQSVKNLLADASQKYNVPIQVLMANLYLENCRSTTTYNGQTASICDKTDEFLAPYMIAHVPYPHTAGCPNQDRPVGSGVFQFNLGYWQAFVESPLSNACSIPDSFYDAARWQNANYSSNGNASAIGDAPAPGEWSLPKMKLALTRWAENVDTCEPTEFGFAAEYCRVVDALMGIGSYQPLTPVSTTCHPQPSLN